MCIVELLYKRPPLRVETWFRWRMVLNMVWLLYCAFVRPLLYKAISFDGPLFLFPKGGNYKEVPRYQELCQWAWNILCHVVLFRRKQITLWHKYDRYLHKTSAIVFTVQSTIKWAESHLCSGIITEATLFICVLYSPSYLPTLCVSWNISSIDKYRNFGNSRAEEIESGSFYGK